MFPINNWCFITNHVLLIVYSVRLGVRYTLWTEKTSLIYNIDKTRNVVFSIPYFKSFLLELILNVEFSGWEKLSGIKIVLNKNVIVKIQNTFWNIEMYWKTFIPFNSVPIYYRKKKLLTSERIYIFADFFSLSFHIYPSNTWFLYFFFK